MGLGIGQVTGPLASIRSAPEVGQTRLVERESPLRGSSPEPESGVEAFLRRQEETGSRGRASTLSTPAAALRTISTTVQQARERTPTIQEIRVRFRAESVERRAEVQRTAFNRPIGESTRSLELQIPEPSAQVRNFVSDTNETRNNPSTGLGEDETGANVRLGAAQDEPGRPVSLGPGGNEGAEEGTTAPNERAADVGREIPANRTDVAGTPEPALIDTQIVPDEPEPVGFSQASGSGAPPDFAAGADVPGPRVAESGSQFDVRV